MATIKLDIQGSTVGTISVTDTLTQVDSDRFMAWLGATYAGVDDQGNPLTPDAMIADCWAGIRAGIFNNIKRYEQDVAAQAAKDAVVDLSSTTAVEHTPPTP